MTYSASDSAAANTAALLPGLHADVCLTHEAWIFSKFDIVVSACHIKLKPSEGLTNFLYVCRNIAALAIGQYWLPQVGIEAINDAYARREADDPDNSDHALGDAASVDSMTLAGAQDLEDRSAVIHDDMPLLKAHGTKHAVAAGPSTVLQDSNKQDFVKPNRLVNAQSLVPQSKTTSKAEALGALPVPSGRNANPSNTQ